MELSERIALSRRATMVAYIAMILSLVASNISATSVNLAVLAFQVTPLLIFLPGLLKGNTRSHVWLGCLLLVYSTKFISDLVVSEGSLISVLQTLCGVLLFAAAMLYVRWQGQLRKQEES